MIGGFWDEGWGIGQVNMNLILFTCLSLELSRYLLDFR